MCGHPGCEVHSIVQQCISIKFPTPCAPCVKVSGCLVLRVTRRLRRRGRDVPGASAVEALQTGHRGLKRGFWMWSAMQCNVMQRLKNYGA